MKNKAKKKTDTAKPTHILKCPNRRLYCLVESRYINLDEVRRRVKARQPVTIISKQTKQDITTAELLKVLLHDEERGEGKIPLETLLEYLRSPANAAYSQAA